MAEAVDEAARERVDMMRRALAVERRKELRLRISQRLLYEVARAGSIPTADTARALVRSTDALLDELGFPREHSSV